ncbi:winged helix-turn-helix transcriptional regulator [Jiangella endophytica]|uniref:winged helix-turn-helix transcriptional regulator n=1 Tax=Jiangella endophytica TaxID=1623398 RepID=UPI001E50E54E|nr:helix-turn-helix domain-containing protein [Jiangella endophytica]
MTQTAAARRAEARRVYNANLLECPGHQLLAALSDKWVTLVVSALGDGALWCNELVRVVAGASQRMFTKALQRLERDGIGARMVAPAVPVRVDYALTDLGVRLLPLQWAVKDWAEANIDEVLAAHGRYDEAVAAGVADAH